MVMDCLNWLRLHSGRVVSMDHPTVQGLFVL